MVKIVTTGTVKCSFCSLEEEHDDLFKAWAQGDLTRDEVGERVGLSGDAWQKHLQRHVPNWRALAAEVSVVYGGEVERSRARVLAVAGEAEDPTDREHLLELCVLSLRGHLLAMTERGISSEISAGRTAQMLSSEVEKATAALDKIRREREDREMETGRLKAKDARVELECLKAEIREMFSSDPDIAGRVNDILNGEAPSPEEQDRLHIERSKRLLEGRGYIIVPPPDSVEWGGGVEDPSEPVGEEGKALEVEAAPELVAP